MAKDDKMFQRELGGKIGEGAENYPNSINERTTPNTEDYPRIISQVNKGGGTEGVRGPNSPASFRNEYDEKNDPETNLRGQFVSNAVETTEGRI